jgi:hypothetical protein
MEGWMERWLESACFRSLQCLPIDGNHEYSTGNQYNRKSIKVSDLFARAAASRWRASARQQQWWTDTKVPIFEGKDGFTIRFRQTRLDVIATSSSEIRNAVGGSWLASTQYRSLRQGRNRREQHRKAHAATECRPSYKNLLAVSGQLHVHADVGLLSFRTEV